MNILSLVKADLITSLNILWQGLLAIVIVIGAIILVTTLMNKVVERRAKKKAERDAENSDTPRN